MARSITTITDALKAGLVSAASSVGLTIVPTNWSKTDYKLLTLATIAQEHGIQEQLYDSHVLDIEDIVSKKYVQTAGWIQDQMINYFQYDATAVPVVQLDSTTTFTPYYPVKNTAWNIVKYCSVVPGIFGTTTVKIAGAGPSTISATPLSAAQSFMNTIAVPGITYNVVSSNSDKLFMQLDVYYKGAYSNVIQANVIAKINSFLLEQSTKNFGGIVLISLLEKAILEVEGVVDVVLVNIQARSDGTTVGTGTNLVQNKTELQRSWSMISGYMIPENTAGANWQLTDFRVGASGIKNLNLISQ